MKRVYIYINGIFNCPGSADGWTDRAVTWTHNETEYRAEKYEYFAGALTRRIGQQKRARKISVMISHYHKYPEIVLVGHSNGCDVILRVLRLIGARPIAGVHLIAPACEPDLDKNGLTYLMHKGIVESLKIYLGGKDGAMKAAKWSTTIAGWLGLGYGNLGGQKPEDLEQIIGPENVIYEAGFKHSTWFENDAILDSTLKIVTA